MTRAKHWLERQRAGRRRALLGVSAASLIGAFALWGLAVSSGREAGRTALTTVQPAEERALVSDQEQDPTRRAKEARETRPPPAKTEEERPRTRLPAGHEPAFGKAVARVRIPAIDVDAPVISLGKNKDKTLQVPGQASEAGWWSGGARPGRPGASVVVGHVDSRSGPGVFYRLDALSTGDEIEVVYPNGSRARFAVTHRRQTRKNNFPTKVVYGDTEGPTLRLVTCAGSFDHSRGHYRSNLIVFARSVN